MVPTRMVCGDLPPGALVGSPGIGRLAELKLIVAAPLEAELVQERRRECRSQFHVERIDLDEVVAEVIDGARVSCLRLNPSRRLPTQTVVTHGQCVLLVNVPVNLRQEELLVASARNRSCQAERKLIVLLICASVRPRLIRVFGGCVRFRKPF